MPRLALLLWLLLVANWTLTPAPEAAAAAELTPWWCISCGAAGTADFLQNLLLFAPIGACLRAMRWSLPRTASLTIALTVGIEAAQATLLPGRDAALGDLLANGIGGVLGWIALPALSATWRPSPRVARHFATSMLTLFTLQLLASAWLLRPSPGGGPWETQLAPARHDGATYPGTVLGAAIFERPDGTALVVTTTWERVTATGMVPLARLVRPDDGEIAGASIGANRVAMGMRARASDLRLRSPTVSIPLPQLAIGDTMEARLTHASGALELQLSAGSGGPVAGRAPTGAQHGWVLINPFARRVDLPGGWQRWTLAWLAGWGLLLGWGAWASGRGALWAVGGGITGMGVPWITGTPLTLVECIVLGSGWIVAAVAGRRHARGHPETG